MNSFHRLLLIACLVLVPSVAQSATATLSASKDNTIFQNQVNNSAGGAAGIFSGSNGTGSPRRGLIAFDVASAIPAGAIITAAELRMYLGNAPNNNAQTIGLHRLNVNWGEGAAGNSAPGIGGGGNGFAAGAGDATWNTPTFGSGAWTNPGATGDFNATASTSTPVTGPVETAFIWLSTPTLLSDVQGWLNSPATNFGWALVSAGEGTSASVKAFYSRSATQNAGGGTLDPAFRPLLTVTYEGIPEPSSAILFVLSCTLAYSTRRR
jgi:hypothetical protein